MMTYGKMSHTAENEAWDLEWLRGQGRLGPLSIAEVIATIERLTRERDEAREYGKQARLRENAAEDAHVSLSFELAKAREVLADVRRWTLFELQYGAGREPWPARLAKIDAALSAKPEKPVPSCAKPVPTVPAA